MSDPAAIIRRRVLAKYPASKITLMNAFEVLQYLDDVKDARTEKFVEDKYMSFLAAILEELEFLFEGDEENRPSLLDDNDNDSSSESGESLLSSSAARSGRARTDNVEILD
jgi:hypothetical protein